MIFINLSIYLSISEVYFIKSNIFVRFSINFIRFLKVNLKFKIKKFRCHKLVIKIPF